MAARITTRLLRSRYASLSSPADAGLLEQGGEGQPGGRPPGQGDGPAQDAENGGKSEGKGDQDPDDILKNGENGTDEKEHRDLGSAGLEQGNARPEADRGEDGDHQGVAECRIELKNGQ